MKKLLSIALCTAAVAAFGSTEISLGEVGVTKVVSGFKNTIISASFTELTGGDVINPSNLVKTTGLTDGDVLKAYKNNAYQTWTLQNGQWVANEQVFSQEQNGEPGAAPDAYGMSVGEGIFLTRGGDDLADKPIYIYGRPSTEKTVAVVPTNWNLIGNPNQVPFTVNFGSEGDSLLVAVEGDVELRRYVHKGGTWQYTKHTVSEVGEEGKKVRVVKSETKFEAPVVPAGLGCWYCPTIAESVDWTITAE